RTIYSNVRNRNTYNAEDYYKIAEEIKRISDENDRIYSHRLFGVMYLASDRLFSTRCLFIPGFEDDAPIFDDFKVHFEMNYPKYIVINDKRFYNGKTDEYINDLLLKQYELINSINHVKLYKIK
ncbi:hypothetical protein, partial [Helcococcus bovis]|uniref:hypothetical protein n=1 Tax=Helcococcus bovis TaxID=3153252 RepID=UPI0038BA857C